MLPSEICEDMFGYVLTPRIKIVIAGLPGKVNLLS
jgi:hypothetical protein